MKERTEDEWRELVRRLRLIASDKEEERSRRQRALAILETVPPKYLTPPVGGGNEEADWTEVI